MPLKINYRAAIVVLLAVLFVGFTASRSFSAASDQTSTSFKVSMADDWGDDNASPTDFLSLPLAQVGIPLTGLLILIIGVRPRPARASFAVNYPVLPQGPPR